MYLPLIKQASFCSQSFSLESSVTANSSWSWLALLFFLLSSISSLHLFFFCFLSSILLLSLWILSPQFFSHYSCFLVFLLLSCHYSFISLALCYLLAIEYLERCITNNLPYRDPSLSRSVILILRSPPPRPAPSPRLYFLLKWHRRYLSEFLSFYYDSWQSFQQVTQLWVIQFTEA